MSADWNSIFPSLNKRYVLCNIIKVIIDFDEVTQVSHGQGKKHLEN